MGPGLGVGGRLMQDSSAGKESGFDFILGEGSHQECDVISFTILVMITLVC